MAQSEQVATNPQAHCKAAMAPGSGVSAAGNYGAFTGRAVELFNPLAFDSQEEAQLGLRALPCSCNGLSSSFLILVSCSGSLFSLFPTVEQGWGPPADADQGRPTNTARLLCKGDAGATWALVPGRGHY